jgi:hypothetical protein
MTIWNRWGELIFESNDPNVGWDGRTRNGAVGPPGVYVYVVKIKGPRGEDLSFKGYATLIQ